VRQVLHLIDPIQGYNALRNLWRNLKPLIADGSRFELEIRPERRTTEQNARLWAMLTDVSRQVVWHGQSLSPDDWKHIFSASQKQQRVAPGIDGGFVVLGQSTSQMTKGELSELMELIAAFGAERDVIWSNEEQTC
jgi:hypothetical protein